MIRLNDTNTEFSNGTLIIYIIDNPPINRFKIRFIYKHKNHYKSDIRPYIYNKKLNTFNKMDILSDNNTEIVYYYDLTRFSKYNIDDFKIKDFYFLLIQKVNDECYADITDPALQCVLREKIIMNEDLSYKNTYDIIVNAYNDDGSITATIYLFNANKLISLDMSKSDDNILHYSTKDDKYNSVAILYKESLLTRIINTASNILHPFK